MALACRLILRHPTARPKLLLACLNRRCSSVSLLGSQLEKRWQQQPIRRSLGTQARIYVDPKLSYAYGRSSDHLIYSTVGRELERQIGETPDEVVYVSHGENKSVTFRQLDQDINRLLKGLRGKCQIKRGDVVGVFAYNCYNWILIQFACARLGATLTPINPSYKPHELAFILKKGQVKCLFLPGPKSSQMELNDHMGVLQSREVLELSARGELKLEQVVLMDSENFYAEEDVPFNLNCQLYNWSQLVENDGRVFGSAHEAEEAGVEAGDACIVSPDSVSPDDLMAIYYTSGTTGFPKGACVSHFACINNIRIVISRIRQGRPRDWRLTYVSCLPMFHIFAGLLINMGPLMGQAKVVFPGPKYDIEALIKAAMEHRATILVCTPTILIDSLAYIERHKLSQQLDHLKQVQCGGAHLSPEVAAKCFKILPHLEEMRLGYGSTENASVATFQTMHEPAEVRTLTVGPPIDFCELRIVEIGSDRVVEHGARGEVQTRGHNTMVEYLDEPAKTNEVITPSRWYRTGDIGLMHPHGSLQVCGRLKHMIIKGGENIYPEEVELMIHKLEFVEDVHVVGVPDKRFGEQVCAWIKLKPGYRGEVTHGGADYSPLAPSSSQQEARVVKGEDIVRYCKENMTYFKVPKYVLFVEEFPMTPTKKVQNVEMSKISCKILGLEPNSPGFMPPVADADDHQQP